MSDPFSASPNHALPEQRLQSPALDVETAAPALSLLATEAWRIKQRILNSTGETKGEMKRFLRHINAMYEAFSLMEIEIKDHTGDDFDYGIPLRVAATQPIQKLEKPKIIETLKPTIYWHKKMIQSGEVVVGTPLDPNTPK